ncbi:2-isopropylmalate synthase [Cedecea neteri]|uniref:2-isopropylmalate synthase n=1 Tax=Cedecea neteri TaxID=158822 RepID=A0A2X2T6C2_9ENTR|nr:2-isopropylmalate synthase [Cedecea neteri]
MSPFKVLTQARSDLIERTFASLEGAHSATLHLYNATAPLFRKLVFRQSKEEIIQLAVTATRQVRALCEAKSSDALAI